MKIARRNFILQTLAASLTSSGVDCYAASTADVLDLQPFRTPYKHGKLLLAGSEILGAFDEKFVDSPFVFSANGRFYMSYVGYDSIGCQTGLAESRDLLNWRRLGMIMAREPDDSVARYSISLLSILRDHSLPGAAELKKVRGRYVGAWVAHPSAGFEVGPGVIGLAWSDDLLHWERSSPILRPEDGAAWERGGLYKPHLIESEGTYFLFYNAKSEGSHWTEQTGLATSNDMKTWKRYERNPIVPVGPSDALDARCASDPFVVRYRERWGLYYFGLDTDNKARELLAIGDDLFRFTKTPEVLIDVGGPGAVDESFAHKPSVITFRGDLYHFYSAAGGHPISGSRGISVARSIPWPE